MVLVKIKKEINEMKKTNTYLARSEKENLGKHSMIVNQYVGTVRELYETLSENRVKLVNLSGVIKAHCKDVGVPFKAIAVEIAKQAGIQDETTIYRYALIHERLDQIAKEISKNGQGKNDFIDRYEMCKGQNISALRLIANIGKEHGDIIKESLKTAVDKNLSKKAVDKLIKELKKKKKIEKYTRAIDEIRLEMKDSFFLNIVDSEKEINQMSDIPDESVNLVVTSPPYNVDFKYPNYSDHKSSSEYFRIHLEIAKAIYRVLVPGGLVIYIVPSMQMPTDGDDGNDNDGPIYYGKILNMAGFKFYDKKIWHKKETVKMVFGGPDNPTSYHDCEHIIIYKKPGERKRPESIPPLEFEYYKDNIMPQIWNISPRKNSNDTPTDIHPCAFSDELCERLINGYSFIGNTVLDPFAGSCSLGFVANRLGRTFIGYEIDRIQFTHVKDKLERMNKGQNSTMQMQKKAA